MALADEFPGVPRVEVKVSPLEVIAGAERGLPIGVPAFALAGMGVNLRFVVLADLDVEDKFFVALVTHRQELHPLAFTKTFDDALSALGAITTGFQALGFTVGSATIQPYKEDENENK